MAERRFRHRRASASVGRGGRGTAPPRVHPRSRRPSASNWSRRSSPKFRELTLEKLLRILLVSIITGGGAGLHFAPTACTNPVTRAR